MTERAFDRLSAPVARLTLRDFLAARTHRDRLHQTWKTPNSPDTKRQSSPRKSDGLSLRARFVLASSQDRPEDLIAEKNVQAGTWNVWFHVTDGKRIPAAVEFYANANHGLRWC